MPVAFRKLVKEHFQHAQVDFETVYHGVGVKWLVYDSKSGFLLALGCDSAYLAWKVAYSNVEKVAATIRKANA